MDLDQKFIDVIKENEGLIFKISTIYTNTTESREDLFQEIVYQLWKSFNSYNGKSKISTWMYQVALNTAIFYLKKDHKIVNTVPLDLDTHRIPDNLDKTLEEEEKTRVMYEKIQQLNLMEKGVILLYLEGKSHLEIGTLLGISITNVGTKISRIKLKLKEQIKIQ